jgi:hypothetical protein
MSKSCKFYVPSAFPLRLTHLGTLLTGKFTRIWGFHSSVTATEHWLGDSTGSYPMRGTPYFGNLEAKIGRLEGNCASKGYSATVTCFSCFSLPVRQVPGCNSKQARPALRKNRGHQLKWSPAPKVDVVICQSVSNFSGFSSQISKRSSFHKGPAACSGHHPSIAIAPSLNKRRPSTTADTPLA